MKTNNQEQLILNENFSQTYKEIGLKYNLSENQIRHIFRKNGVKKTNPNNKSILDITEDEKLFFKENINNYSYKYFIDKFKTTEKVIINLSKEMGLKKERCISYPRADVWTPQELSKLYAHRDKSIKELTTLLPSRNEKAIKKKFWELKIQYEDSISNSRWSEEEKDFITKNYKKMPVGTIAYFLNRSIRAIEHQIADLDLKNTSKQTYIEEIIQKILEDFSVNFVFNTRISPKFQFRPDFTIEEFKIIIECHGDFWHGNPSKYSEDDLSTLQLLSIEKDAFKKEFYESLGYKVIILWEKDIRDNLDYVTQEIKDVITPSNKEIY